MYTYENHTEEKVEKVKEAAEVMLHNPYMTQKELGEMFGVNPRTIRAWVKSYEHIDMTGYNKIRANFREHGQLEKVGR